MSFGNKYNSQIQTFYATDLFNLPMPALPPADLTILTSSFVPSYFFFRNAGAGKVGGFNPRDNAFVRGLGLQSNLADGLVSADTGSGGPTTTLKGWNLTLTPQAFDMPVSACTQVAGTNQITGAGFNSFYSVSQTVMWVDDNGVARTGVIQSINAGGTAITLTAISTNTLGTMYTASMASGRLYLLQKQIAGDLSVPVPIMNTMDQYSFFAWTASQLTEPAGTVSVSAGSTALVGVGTSFITDYGAGSGTNRGQSIGYTDNTGVRRTAYISTVLTDTTMTLANVAPVTALKSPIINLNGFVAYRATIINDFKAYTITIDPAFGNGTRRLSISAMAEIEYTHGISGVI